MTAPALSSPDRNYVMAAITEASRSAGVSGAVRMAHRFALGKGESISVDPGSDSLKAFAVRRQRLKRGD